MKSYKLWTLVDSVRLILTASLTAVFFAGAAEAENGIRPLVPVAFYSFRSNIPEQKAAVVAQSISRHLAAMLVDVYSTEMIGTTSAFSPKLDLGVINSATYGISQLDIAMEQKVMPELAPILNTLSSDEKAKFSVEIYWADSETIDNLPSDSRIGSGIIEALQLSDNPMAATFIAQHWVDLDEVDPSGTIRASLSTTKMLRQLRADHVEQWIPFTSDVSFGIDKHGIEIDFLSLMLPNAFIKSLHKKQPGVTLDNLLYIPTAYNDRIDLVKLAVRRQYTEVAADGSNSMHVVFGAWNGMTFVTCNGDGCLASVDRLPTLHARVNFSATNWWGSLVGWFRSWIISTVDLRIMFRDIWLSCDRDTQEFSVDPSKSVIPIAMTTDQIFGSGTPYMLQNSTTSLGFNFYEIFVGTQVTSGLSADLNTSVREADRALSDAIGGALSRIAQP